MPQIDENDVRVVEDDEPIQYYVSSCLTVTCGFADGTRIGAHFSHGAGAVGTFGDSVATWQVFKDAVATKGGGVVWVKVRGQIDMWSPAYLTDHHLTADTAVPGDLTDTISWVTGGTPDIAHQNGSIVVLPDGMIV